MAYIDGCLSGSTGYELDHSVHQEGKYEEIVHIANTTRLFQVIFDKASNLHDTVMNIKMLSLRS